MKIHIETLVSKLEEVEKTRL